MSPSDGIPPVQFADARGARVAFQTFGHGPDIVAIPPTAQNIEVGWEWPRIRQMLDRQATFARWTIFDKRGSGASDRRSEQPGLDERVEDLRAVMDAAGVERAFLYGASEGGPTCIMFAVTYPERVEGLILHGSGVRTSAAVPPERRDDFERGLREYCRRWGTSESTIVDGFAPSIADEPGYREWHQRYERLAATPESLFDIIDISTTIDVSDVLDQVDVPTLVLHNTNDRVIPVEAGRRLAREIENARLIEYPSEDHFAYTDLAYVDDIERFVTGAVADRPPRTPTASPTSVEIVTLGAFRVLRDGVEVPNPQWGSRRARQLCKRLVAARGWPVTREELFEQLWPDETDPGKLGPRLSVVLSAVRKVLGGAIHATRSAVSLDLAAVAVDLEAFFELTDDRAIVNTFAGDFCPGDVDEPWSNGIRHEARSRFTAAVYRLADPSNDRHGVDIESLLRRVIALDSWDDRAHRTLVEHLVAHDRVADARRAHQVWSAAMAELDAAVEPFDAFL